MTLYAIEWTHDDGMDQHIEYAHLSPEQANTLRLLLGEREADDAHVYEPTTLSFDEVVDQIKLDLPVDGFALCASCDHFVDDNDAIAPEGMTVAAYIHLSSDDHPWLEHEATPRGEPMPLGQWQAERPDLFVQHPDAIGPNSVYHHHPNQTDEERLAAIDALFHDHLPEGANCPGCGIDHAAINPQNLRS